jgi:hypothetical protein
MVELLSLDSASSRPTVRNVAIFDLRRIAKVLSVPLGEMVDGLG